MLNKLMSTLKTKVVTPNDIRIALFILTLILFAIGAGAPSDHGGLGGY